MSQHDLSVTPTKWPNWSEWDEAMRWAMMYTPKARMFYHPGQRHVIEAILRQRLDSKDSVRFDFDLAGYGYGHMFVWITPTTRGEVSDELIEAARKRGFVMIHIDEGYAQAAYEKENPR